MYTESELIDAIEELNNGSHTISNVSKLASVYTVLDHIAIGRGYSTESKSNEITGYTPPVSVVAKDMIGNYGDSEFLTLIKGKSPERVWALMDELMDTLSLVNISLYNSVLDRLDMMTE